MPLALTIDAVSGNKLNAPIGTALVLSEASSFLNIDEVTWELTLPPGSSATLTTAGVIAAAPFDNGFTPDVPGSYRVRLIATYADGSTDEDTQIVSVDLPHHSGELPAPLESRERDATIGWSADVNELLNDLLEERSATERIRYVNRTGGAINQDTVQFVDGLRDWPTETGGTVVAGADLDYIAEIAGGTDGIPVLLEGAGAPNGARGNAVRRGFALMDTSSWSVGDELYRTSTGALANTVGAPTTLSKPVARVITSAATGIIWFDPSGATGPGGDPRPFEITLADNTSSWTDVGGPFSWDLPITSYAYSYHYAIKRPDSEFSEVGVLHLLMNGVNNVGQALQQRLATSGGTGVSLRLQFTAGSPGTFTLQFQTTNTGDDAVLQLKPAADFA